MRYIAQDFWQIGTNCVTRNIVVQNDIFKIILKKNFSRLRPDDLDDHTIVQLLLIHLFGNTSSRFPRTSNAWCWCKPSLWYHKFSPEFGLPQEKLESIWDVCKRSKFLYKIWQGKKEENQHRMWAPRALIVDLQLSMFRTKLSRSSGNISIQHYWGAWNNWIRFWK